MFSAGLFTQSDFRTITKAAVLAETLTQRFFDLPLDGWRREPYSLFTRKEVCQKLYERDAFAQLIRYAPGSTRPDRSARRERYGVVLQDPNILMALLRSSNHDLWTLMLFVLTHELVHIVRFSRHNVDFFAPIDDRDREENLVHDMTREILSGVSNTDNLITLYENAYGLAHQESIYKPISTGGAVDAHI
jgi:hypothetical protein